MNSSNNEHTKIEEIYCLKAISLRKKTNEDREKDLKILNIEYNRNQSIEDYEKFLKEWGEYTYSMGSFVVSYHLTKDEANRFATSNAGDFNEAGCYNYACVEKIPLGCTYYNTYQNKDEDFILYKYNNETHNYEPLDKTTKEYKRLLYYCWGMYAPEIKET